MLLSVAATVFVALVLRRGNGPEQRFLLVYMAPLFVFGAAWARQRLAQVERLAPEVIAVDAMAFLLGAVRMWGGWGLLPYSGHMLFLTYAVVTPGTARLRVASLALIGMTTAFKLWMWNDPRSWSLGVAGGLALAGVRALLARRARGLVAAR